MLCLRLRIDRVDASPGIGAGRSRGRPDGGEVAAAPAGVRLGVRRIQAICRSAGAIVAGGERARRADRRMACVCTREPGGPDVVTGASATAAEAGRGTSPIAQAVTLFPGIRALFRYGLALGAFVLLGGCASTAIQDNFQAGSSLANQQIGTHFTYFCATFRLS